MHHKPLPLQETFPVELFAAFNNWITHNGVWQPVPDEQLVKVMYSNGSMCNIVTNACTWRVWTGGRDWWINPGDGRMHITAYVVI